MPRELAEALVDLADLTAELWTGPLVRLFGASEPPAEVDEVEEISAETYEMVENVESDDRHQYFIRLNLSRRHK